MNAYELIYILRPELDEEARETVLNKIKSVLTSSEAELEKVEEWGNKRLAYEIQKLREGYYVFLVFKSDAQTPKEVDRILKINDQVIRHMIVKIDEKVVKKREKLASKSSDRRDR